MVSNAIFPCLSVFVRVMNISNFFMSSINISTYHTTFVIYVLVYVCVCVCISHDRIHKINFKRIIWFDLKYEKVLKASYWYRDS